MGQYIHYCQLFPVVFRQKQLRFPLRQNEPLQVVQPTKLFLIRFSTNFYNIHLENNRFSTNIHLENNRFSTNIHLENNRFSTNIHLENNRFSTNIHLENNRFSTNIYLQNNRFSFGFTVLVHLTHNA